MNLLQRTSPGRWRQLMPRAREIHHCAAVLWIAILIPLRMKWLVEWNRREPPGTRIVIFMLDAQTTHRGPTLDASQMAGPQ